MCLIVLEGTKKNIAETDINVYKCLDFDFLNKTYCTPFRYLPIEFQKGICKINSIIGCSTYEGIYPFGRIYPVDDFKNPERIDVGIHSYYLRDYAEITARKFYDSSGTRVHKAIIPKGSEYYIGKRGEIVSNNLIIFEMDIDYMRYCEKNCVMDLEF